MTVGEVVGAVSLIGGIVAGALRWLRVSQREHYLPGSASRFAQRWLASNGVNTIIAVLVLVNFVVGLVYWPSMVVAAGGLVVWPLGLDLRGRSSPLAWTPRMVRLASATAIWLAVPIAIATALGNPVAGVLIAAALVPPAVDLAALVTKPLESHLLATFVRDARARLDEVDPTVIAITGSYGKTTTKQYLRALLEGTVEVCPSPASFNNRAGLARAVNEQLHAGTQVFIAEMGTYGPGEIADLCGWMPPDIAVLTSIGPVHLERMRSLDNIVAAKSEIFEHAATAVLNVDDERLAPLTDQLERAGKRVIRCGTTSGLDVVVDEVSRDSSSTTVSVTAGDRTCEATAPDGALHLSNLACAVGAALAQGLDPEMIEQGIGRLRSADHRQTIEVGPSGVWVIDDSFNSNPAGAASALERLATIETDGQRVVVTPGMVELGPLQRAANTTFGAQIAEVADVVVLVGSTNRWVLFDGVDGTETEVQWFATREGATEWVRENLEAGDAVLYENDLPDHYP